MLRGCASAYVFAGHVCPGYVVAKAGVVAFALKFGQEAVMCFFLLSGFVIYYSHHLHHDRSLSTYLVRRSRRIYPIFLLALGISYFVSVFASDVHADWRDFLGNLFMLQDFSGGKPGVWVNPFSDNVPLWSLSYEVWFYAMFFPIYSRVPICYQLPIVALISLGGLFSYASFPNQISLFLLYFILWWTGLEIARTYCRGIRPTFYTQRYSVFILAAFCVLVPLVTLGFMAHPQHLSFGLHPLLEIRHFAACFTLLCGGLAWSCYRWRGFSLVFGVFSLFAPISYALYVFHYPLLAHTAYLGWLPNPFVRTTVAISITLFLAYCAEVPLQRAINRFTRRRRPRPKFIAAANGSPA